MHTFKLSVFSGFTTFLFAAVPLSAALAQVPPAVSISTTSLTPATIGTAFSDSFQTSGGVPPFTWSASNLPSGIAVDPNTGAISGTPTMPAGTWSWPIPNTRAITVQVQDSVGQIATSTINWTVTPTITYSRTPSGNSPLPNPAVINLHVGAGSGSCGNWYITNTNGSNTWLGYVDSPSSPFTVGPGDYSITLPSGYYNNFRAFCSAGAPQDFLDSFTVSSLPSITTNLTLQTGTVGQPYTATLQYSLSTGRQTVAVPPYTWSVTSGALPSGLVLDPSTGVISGTPSASATSTFTVQIEDGIGQTDSKTLTLYSASAPPPTITTTSLPAGTIGTAFSGSLQASGGSAPYTWSATNLPPGVAVDPASGIISGTPTMPAGTWSLPIPTSRLISVQVQDSIGQIATSTINWAITPTVTYTRTPTGSSPLQNPTVISLHVGPGSGACANWYITGSNGANTWLGYVGDSSSPFTVGPGDYTLTLASGNYNNLRLLCSAGAPQDFLESFTVSSLPTITTSPLLQPGTVGQSYSNTLQYSLSTGRQTVAVPPYTWSVTSGALPAGLTLNQSTGVILGIPQTSATSTFTIQIADGIGQTDSVAFTLFVTNATPPSIITASLAPATIGSTFTGTFEASGGSAPYTWSATNLPSGVTVDAASGVISGTPTMLAGTWSWPIPNNRQITVQVQDSVGQIATTSIDWVITPTITYTRTPSGDGLLSNPAIVALHVGPGSSSCANWYVTDLNTGANVWIDYVDGPSSPFTVGPGDYTLTLSSGHYDNLRVFCSAGVAPDLLDSFAVSSVPSITTNALLQPGIVGQPYATNLEYSLSTGRETIPVPPYTWTITSGALPVGLTLDVATGVISGTPASTASSTFTVQIEDGIGQTDSVAFTMYTFLPISISPSSLFDGKVGVSYTQALQAVNGTSPYMWTLESGSLPEGLTLDQSTGVISGTPVTMGTASFTIRVVDGNSISSTRAYSIAVTSNSPPVIAPIGDKTVNEGQALTFTVSATDPDGDALTYSASNLPTGATFNPATRVFSWTPGYGQAGNYGNVEFTVADSGTPMQLALEDITITVGHVNRAPIFSSVGSQQASTTAAMSFAVSATDPDGDTVVLSATGLPTGASFNPSSGVFAWTPAYNQAGVYTVTFTATDNGAPIVAVSNLDVVISVSASSPTTLTQNIIDTITGSGLPANQQNSYLANLRKVSIFIDNGQINSAINQLNAFIQKLNQSYSQGKITQAEYQDYLAQAQMIIEALQ